MASPPSASPARFRATRRGWAGLAALVAVVALYALLPGTSGWCRNLVQLSLNLWDNRALPPEMKAYAVLHDPYRLIITVRDNTPATSRILIPSGPKHAPLSSSIWCTYYLYPRRVYHLEEIAGPLVGRIDAILVHDRWGLDLSGYPADSTREIQNGVIDLLPSSRATGTAAAGPVDSSPAPRGAGPAGATPPGSLR